MNIFVISLKDSHDRRKQMEEQLHGQGLEFEFFDAVDARAGVPEQYEPLVDREAIKRQYFRDMTSGEIGCALSHALVYQTILERHLNEAIILEDDMWLHQDFGSMVRSNALREAGKDIILFFSFNFRAFKWIDRPFFKQHRRYAYSILPTSAGAYYVTRKGAGQLHKAALPISYVADWPLLIPFRMRCAGIYPHLAEPFGIDSLLEDGRQESEEQRDAGEMEPAKANFKEDFVVWLKRLIDRIYSDWLMPRLTWEVRPTVAQVEATTKVGRSRANRE